MTAVEAIGYLPAMQGIGADLPGAVGDAANGSGFAAWFSREMAATNGKLLEADHQVQQLAAGESTNLHQVMIALEDARLSFQLLVQVRNHLLDGYQDILRMQV